MGNTEASSLHLLTLVCSFHLSSPDSEDLARSDEMLVLLRPLVLWLIVTTLTAGYFHRPQESPHVCLFIANLCSPSPWTASDLPSLLCMLENFWLTSSLGIHYFVSNSCSLMHPVFRFHSSCWADQPFLPLCGNPLCRQTVYPFSHC